MMKVFLLIVFFIIPFQLLANEEASSKSIKNTPQTLNIEKIPSLHIDLSSPFNFIPLITIFIVVCSTIVSIRTITIKTNESKDSFNESLKIQRKISEDEVRINVLSSSRQEWINTLRNELAEFISILHQLEIELNANPRGEVLEFSGLLTKLELRASKIRLLINPKEDDHKKLILLIKKAVNKSGDGYEYMFDINEDIITLSQKILKDEWNVLKSFKDKG